MGYYYEDSELLVNAAVDTLWAVNDLKMAANNPVIVYLRGDTFNFIDWRRLDYDESNSLDYKYKSHPAPAAPKGMTTPPDTPRIEGATALHVYVGRDRIGDVPDLSALSRTLQRASAMEKKELAGEAYLKDGNSDAPTAYCYNVGIALLQDYFKGISNFSPKDMSLRVDHVFNGNKIAGVNVPAQSSAAWSSSDRLCVERRYLQANSPGSEVHLEVSTDFRADYIRDVFIPMSGRVYPVSYSPGRR